MSEYTPQNIVRTNRLREAYGDEIILTEDGIDQPTAQKIVLEFDIHGRSYAVLRPESPDDDEELGVYRVVPLPEGEYEIVTIEDDDEWENVSELVDELTTKFPGDT